MNAEEIRSKYNDPLNLTSVREILKISKLKATWLLQSGYLKCRVTGEKMHQYSVAIDDLVEYINKTESGELIVPFPKRKQGSDEIKDDGTSYAFPINPPAELNSWLTDEWSSLDELLPRTAVIELTGFSERTLKNWGASGKIKTTTGYNTVKVENASVTKMTFIKKNSLIEYLCSDEGFKAANRSGKSSILPTKSVDDLKKYLIDASESYGENLTHSDIVKITGFSLTSVKELVYQNKVEHFFDQGAIKEKELLVLMTLVDKRSLIDYLCGEGYYLRQKPQAFKDLINKFLKK